MDTGKLFLCAVDFSDTCRGSFGLACDLARALEARLLLVHAAESLSRSEYRTALSPDEVERAMAPTRAELEAWRLDAERRLGRTVESLLVEGSPAEEIARVAEARSCDLLVTGTHGRTGVKRLVLGSVAARLLREAPCSVLVVPLAAGAVEAPRRICCAVDLSETSREALRQAADMARALGAQLELVYVRARLVGAPEMMALGAAAQASEAEQLEAELGPWEEEATRWAGSAVAATITQGEPADEVLHRCGAEGTGLLVVGTHGRTGVRRLVLGSVAERIVREARLPVLVARQRAHPSPEAEEPDANLTAGRFDRQRMPPFS